MANSSTTNKEYEGLRNSRATLVGGNSDGKTLFLEVEVFDGEHTNRFEPHFPQNTSAEDVTDYLKSLIDNNSKLPDEIVGLMQKTVFWDSVENSWYTQDGQQKPVRMDDGKHKEKAHHAAHHKKD